MSSGYTFHRPVPSGPLWALEASAGTGKTWTIENFVAAYLADGAIRPEEVVIVTFTKAATAELRSRVRNNIAAIVRGENPTPGASYSEHEHNHLRQALSDYGQLRISTIHGFAQRSLATLGQSTDGFTVIAEDESFLTSVLIDTIRSLTTAQQHELQDYGNYFKHAVSALKALVNNPSAIIRAPNPTAANLAFAHLVQSAFHETKERKRRLGLISMSDFLTKLDLLLDNPLHAAALARSIKVLLIDEFQDTDAVQWSIFKKIRDAGHLTAFVVVGDPKQSIYGFRGGDVQVYREAVDPATANHLDGNRRSTAAFVAGMNEFFEGVNFGLSFPGSDDAGNLGLPGGEVVRPASIEYHRVEAVGSLKSVTDGPAWLFRQSHQNSAAGVREEAISDMPSYIAGLLAGPGIPDPATGEIRPVRLSDICILMGNNKHNANLARELSNASVPVSLFGGANVFSSDAANQWQHFLTALKRPTQPQSLRLFAWTWFGGATIAEIVTHGEDETWLSGQQEKLLNLHELFVGGKRGQFFDDAIRATGVLSFLATHTNAARNITDLKHIAEILCLRTNESIDQLHDFLQRASSSDDDDAVDSEVEGGEWSRRVDGDAEAVQIMTFHKSKGLQFPIVLIPFMSDHLGSNADQVVYRAYKDGVGATYLDLAFKESTESKAIYDAQRTSEVRRKAYVALTRAQIRNVLWTWSGAKRPNVPALRDDSWRAERASLEGPFGWDETDLVPFTPSEPTRTGIALAEFSRDLPAPPRRNSYSSMTHQLTERPVTLTEGDHEPEGPEGGSAVPSGVAVDVLAGLRGSNRIGTAIHAVLEKIATDGMPDESGLRSLVIEAAHQCGVVLDESSASGVSVDGLLELVRRSLSGDLGSLAPGLTLSDFANGRILAEVGFDLTLGAGVSTQEVLTVLRRHFDAESVVGKWIASTEGTTMLLPGFLTGSMDAVLLAGDEDAPVFSVVDYKTNRLPSSMDPAISVQTAMAEHHYYLQALIYLVALHRFVRSRLGHLYSYDHHIGGAGYLFLRAMAPGSSGQGVVHLRPSKECIEELSALFNGESHG